MKSKFDATNLTAVTSYTIKVVVADNVGNTSSSEKNINTYSISPNLLGYIWGSTIRDHYDEYVKAGVKFYCGSDGQYLGKLYYYCRNITESGGSFSGYTYQVFAFDNGNPWVCYKGYCGGGQPYCTCTSSGKGSHNGSVTTYFRAVAP